MILNCEETQKKRLSKHSNVPMYNYPLIGRSIEENTKSLRGSFIITCIGTLSCLGYITSAALFFLEITVTYVNWGTLVSALIFFILGIAWYAIASKFDDSAGIHSQIYREFKKSLEEIKREMSRESSSEEEDEKSV